MLNVIANYVHKTWLNGILIYMKLATYNYLKWKSRRNHSISLWEILAWISTGVKWIMASFRSYGNSVLGEMYPIWNFRLSPARHQCLVFCYTDNGGALVAQSWTVSLLRNPIEGPLSSNTCWLKFIHVLVLCIRSYYCVLCSLLNIATEHKANCTVVDGIR